jgi:hypothetical protein
MSLSADRLSDPCRCAHTRLAHRMRVWLKPVRGKVSEYRRCHAPHAGACAHCDCPMFSWEEDLRVVHTEDWHEARARETESADHLD